LLADGSGPLLVLGPQVENSWTIPCYNLQCVQVLHQGK